ncbi:MAG TPA: tRNA threonylcarbamoyladenosine dehydratase [Verrucomicrobiae bacterium]|jgi:tRNA A37 threonylcarbamoyladenosine dehydratase
MNSDYDERFGGIARLYGARGLKLLRAAHVAVVGIGGVGTWAAEALARSGVGALTLIDLDEICVSNVNRQLHALDGTIGRAKVEVMAERVRAINPECRVQAVAQFFTDASAGELLATKFDYVVDAIDGVANKCRLIVACGAKALPVIVCGAAGGRRDATAVRVDDLAHVTHDRLLSEVRSRLREKHGFPRGGKKFGIECVFSPEPPVYPARDGSICASLAEADVDEERKLNCNLGLGSATFVTGAFGFAAAGLVVRNLAGG